MEKSCRIIFSATLLSFLYAEHYNTCVSKDFGHGSVVCVCNGTYCDFVEPQKRLSPRKKFVVYQSSKSGLRLQKVMGTVEDNNNGSASDVFITVSLDKSYQTLLGFGGAITDAAAINIFTLKNDVRENLLQSYFSKKGIQYSIARVPIGSCDFSTRQYSYDDHDEDFSLSDFNLAEEDLKFKIPLINRAQQLSPTNLSLFASPWSAPAWMKTNHNMTGNGTLKGPVCGKYYETWAQYFIKFLQAYEKHNVTFWGLTAQNEPTDGLLYKFAFQCMGFTAAMQRDFIAFNLGPALVKYGYDYVKLMMLDDTRLMLPTWADTVYSNPDNLKYVSGIAVHWYEDDFITPKLLELTHDKYPGKFIFPTEACTGSMPWENHKPILGSWYNAERYAHSIIQDLNHWAIGWTDWNIALNMEGGPNWVKNYVDSPIIVDTSNQIFYKQPTFYAIGHFSKFLPQKCVRIESSSDTSTELEFVAFLCPSKYIAAVILNRLDSYIPYHIHDSISGFVNGVAPPRSLQTLMWWLN